MQKQNKDPSFTDYKSPCIAMQKRTTSLLSIQDEAKLCEPLNQMKYVSANILIPPSFVTTCLKKNLTSYELNTTQTLSAP